MGSALSSTTTSSRDTPSTNSSSNTESPTDFQNLDSSPILPNPSTSDFDSKTLDPKSKTPETDSQENSVSTKSVDSSIGGNGATQERLDQSEMVVSENADEGEEEGEEGECGFCLFMKAGGCKDSFIAWEQCIEEAEKTKEDIVEKCSDVTGALKKCMEAHADYYEPILRAEKMVEEEAVKELEMEKEMKKEKEASTEGSYQYVVSDSKFSERGGASQ
ncbi:hypothetical protein I3843_07G071000 [Carya illinoinensis]|nr:hypothetical protein I3843_07G071000 [Carya illinoinensis]